MFESVKCHREKNCPTASVSMDTSKPEPEVKSTHGQVMDKMDQMDFIGLCVTYP